MYKPFFSIVTPCFNSEDTIERTIKSILQQKTENYEYIIVDGASTDHTLDIIKKYEPYFGIGMVEFQARFDEIMRYYVNLYPAKKDYYDQIMQDRDKVFTHSIPVYTTHLRPFQVTGKSMQYEGTNAIYNMMNSIVHSINKKKTRFDRNIEQKNQNLYKLHLLKP